MSGENAVIVAVITMAVMQFAFTEVINMISMRDTLITGSLMIAGAGKRQASRGIRLVD